MLPIHALSIRTCATMFPPSSATAMFMGWPISLAFFSAALITRRASSNFTAVMGSPLHRFVAQISETGFIRTARERGLYFPCFHEGVEVLVPHSGPARLRVVEQPFRGE